MPFCTNCGTRVEVESHFCIGCGKSSNNGTMSVRAAAAPAPAVEPLDYTIQGENLQVVRIRLKPGQEVFAEAGKMVYKFPEVRWESRLNGSESPFLTRFYAASASEVGFAGAYPGRIQAFQLKAGQSMQVERDGLLCAQSTTQMGFAPGERPNAGLMLERLSGPGTVFLHGGGDFVEFVLNPGQVLEVDAGSIVAFEDSVGYELRPADAPFGEGLCLAKLTGPGRLVLQSMRIEKMRRELSSFHSGGADEHDAVPALSGVSGS